MSEKNQSPEAPENTQAPPPAAPAAPAAPEKAAPDYNWVPVKFMKDGEPDFQNMAKSYAGLEKKLSTRSNVPATNPDEYTWDAGDFELDDGEVSKFKEEAIKNNFTADQYKFLMTKYKDVVEGMTGVFNPDNSRAALTKEWGRDFDANIASATKAFHEYASSSANRNDPVFQHPEVVKLLANMGRELGEGNITAPGTSSSGGNNIQEQIKALRADPEYWSNPAKQRQMEELYGKLK